MGNNSTKKILIVEDEKNIAQLVAYNLTKNGYEYSIAYDGEDGLEKALSGEYDLILLDLMLPKMDGFEVCRNIRKKLDTPIVIVTARQEEVDKILGLDIGADDYVTKPFSINELMARIGANIRRASNELISNREKKEVTVIRIRELCIDCERYRVTRADAEISLTKTEYELLLYFAQNIGKVFTRDELLKQVWGYDPKYSDERIIDVTVRRLRAKLEDDPANPDYLMTKHKVGYYLK